MYDTYIVIVKGDSSNRSRNRTIYIIFSTTDTLIKFEEISWRI